MKRSPLKRKSPMKRGGRLKSKAKGRTKKPKGRHEYAQRYYERHPQCQACKWLDDAHWLAFRALDPRPCMGSSEMHIHHVWNLPRWDSADGANYLTCCPASHSYFHKHPRYGRLVATWAKIDAGTFHRGTVQNRWGRDPVDAISADVDGGLMGVPVECWEPFYTLVMESF